LKKTPFSKKAINSLTQAKLNQAKINWDEQGQPFSQEFNDVYFNTDSGLDESRFVFIHPSRLQPLTALL
jgi:tRNA 5-methylaminomethyl-2-thiouridine biosynthesis bifunctional protein